MKVVAWLILLLLAAQLFLIPTGQHSTTETPEKATITTITSYPNSDIAALIVAKNASYNDAGPFSFPYDGANPGVITGMDYFGTNVVQAAFTAQGFNHSDYQNPALFPSNCKIYVQIDYPIPWGVLDAASVADLAVTDSRIMGAYIDDFRVGWESPANMSAVSSALHHEDANLSHSLTLALTVYNRNYFVQNPYSWDSIKPYFDIIHFWYAIWTYALLFPGFAGYEDDFMTLHSWLPEKEFWPGIYLHFYNAGSYPSNFTYEQMSIVSRLIKEGYATRFTILANIWIWHTNRATAALVRDFVNNEFKKNYSTVCYMPNSVQSYQNGKPTLTQYIYGINSVEPGSRSFLFTSSRFQYLTLMSTGQTPYMSDVLNLVNIRNGKHQAPYYDSLNQTCSYWIEPGQRYRIVGFPTDYLNLTGNTVITTNTYWTDKIIKIDGIIYLNGSVLSIHTCIIQFGNNHFRNSMINGTVPEYGINVSKLDGSHLILWDTIIEPVNRAFPYYIYREYDNSGSIAPEQRFEIYRSYVACFSDRFMPAGEIVVKYSTLFQAQPCHGDLHSTLWIQSPNYVSIVSVFNSIIWNYDNANSVGLFFMNSWGGFSIPLRLQNDSIVGAEYGTVIDMTYAGSNNNVLLQNWTSYPASDSEKLRLFKRFTFALSGTSPNSLTVETQTIFNWSVKSANSGMKFTMYYPNLKNGIYHVQIDNQTYNVGVTTKTMFVTYYGPYLPYRNNFTVTQFASLTDTNSTIEQLIWLLIFFLVPILMVQYVPKIGFIAGMVLMLLIFGISDWSFVPYMFMGLMSIGILIYKGA